MSLSTYSLLSLAELKAECRVGASTAKDADIETVANVVSELIEQYLDRQIVTRGALTEYHTMEAGGLPLHTAILHLREWPVTSVTSIHESTAWPRVYDGTTLLVSGTDYQSNNPSGRVYRFSSAGGRYQWAHGFRAIKVIYAAGVANTAAVPERIKAVARRLGAMMWAEYERGTQGVQSVSDQLGNFTRFGVATLTADMKADLAPERRTTVFETRERDS